MVKITRGIFFLAVLLLSQTACDSNPPAPAPATPPSMPPVPPGFCEQMNLSQEAYQTGAGGYLFGDLAQDFTVNEPGGQRVDLK